MTLSSILRSAIKYKPSSAADAAKLFSASVSGAASPPIREINDAESLGKKKTCDLPRLPVLPHARPLYQKDKRLFTYMPDILSDSPCTLKECNALIERCIQGSRIATDERGSARHLEEALDMFKSMKRRGIPVEEETYGPLLEYLIDTRMTDDFRIFCDVIKNENPSSGTRLRYYEMMLWIRYRDDKKIQGLIDAFVSYDGEAKTLIQVCRMEAFLLALCDCDRKKEFVQLLESMDITKFSSLDVVARTFKCLGRLLLESFALKILLEYKACDCEAGNTSILIYSYVLGIPNLTVEDVISKFKNMHRKLEVTPSSVSYDKLIIYCCDSLKVHAALDLMDEMIELGLTFSLETFHSILQASTENCDFHLVYRIYSAINQGNLKPNSETFRSMIDLCVKVKDYENAYGLDQMNLMPTAAMYDAIMAEKNMSRGLKLFEEMKEADVKPDHPIFSILLN